MHIVVQFPIIDIRRFYAESDRLSLPNWPIPDLDNFVRFMGPVQRRKLGGIPGINEGIICNAKHIFHSNEVQVINSIRFKIAYKRFYFDGFACAKLEIGFNTYRVGNQKNIRIHPFKLLENLFQYKISIGTGLNTECKLYELKSHLSSAYLRCTSITNRTAVFDKIGIKVRDPFICIHTSPNELQLDNTLVVHRDNKNKFDISFRQFQLYNLNIDTYFFNNKGIPHEYPLTETRQNISFYQLRNFKVSLLRLNAQKETLKYILSLVASKKLRFLKDDLDSNERLELLQEYLLRSSRFLTSIKKYIEANTKSDFLELVLEVENKIYSGFTSELLFKIEEAFISLNVRPNVRKRISEIIDKNKMKQGKTIHKITVGNGVVQVFDGNAQVQNNQLNVTGNSTPTVINKIDHHLLGIELENLRNYVAEMPDIDKRQNELDIISEAIVQNSSENKDTTILAIKKFGKWLLLRAQEVGVGLVIEIAKKAIV
ncbi:hypothetical protein KXD93_28370 [Mucilaginibacter sp. BJC16-A38]|uniref:hypothetical protein n=1 Tax=Mucilaginibacter phenanthrenivorans TaxID=1234842 RepID=UPI0021586C3A|nr:hypothetical protein [Mucilaginibacter phenanthrenivorans]MCR8561603.1 hypothetical protein [Mucilaginibacter phenanthrenivorans]